MKMLITVMIAVVVIGGALLLIQFAPMPEWYRTPATWVIIIAGVIVFLVWLRDKSGWVGGSSSP